MSGNMGRAVLFGGSPAFCVHRWYAGRQGPRPNSPDPRPDPKGLRHDGSAARPALLAAHHGNVLGQLTGVFTDGLPLACVLPFRTPRGEPTPLM